MKLALVAHWLLNHSFCPIEDGEVVPWYGTSIARLHDPARMHEYGWKNIKRMFAWATICKWMPCASWYSLFAFMHILKLKTDPCSSGRRIVSLTLNVNAGSSTCVLGSADRKGDPIILRTKIVVQNQLPEQSTIWLVYWALMIGLESSSRFWRSNRPAAL